MDTAAAPSGGFGLIEAGINRVLALDADTRSRLGEFAGRVICLELSSENEPVRIYVSPHDDGVRLSAEVYADPDVTISGSVPVFLRRLLGRGPVVSDELKIRGDVDLGSRFQRALSGFDPDWEEMLSGWVGDVPAHQLGRAARVFRDFGRRAARTLGMDLTEYLQEEARVLARRERVEDFMKEVDRLRMDADRLEQRLQRLPPR